MPKSSDHDQDIDAISFDDEAMDTDSGEQDDAPFSFEEIDMDSLIEEEEESVQDEEPGLIPPDELDFDFNNPANIMEIPAKTIMRGPIPFTLYSKTSDNRVELFCRSGLEITEMHQQRLKQSVRHLFIPNNHVNSYQEYAQSNLKEIVTDETLDSEEKLDVIHGVGKSIIEDLLANPRSGEQVESGTTFSESLVNFVASIDNVQDDLFALTEAEGFLLSHSLNVGTFSVLIAAQMFGNDPKVLQEVCLGGLLHDVGMSMVNPDIVNSERKLKRHEVFAIRQHPAYSQRLVAEKKLPKSIQAIAGQHHERLDGTGYPGRLVDKEIHPYARIVAVADVYDALTSPRPYREALTHIQAIEIMSSKRHEFDIIPLKVLFHLVLKHKDLVNRYIGPLARRDDDINIDEILFPILDDISF